LNQVSACLLKSSILITGGSHHLNFYLISFSC
jgi:hypothetical protein